jgi:hypothetical protein
MRSSRRSRACRGSNTRAGSVADHVVAEPGLQNTLTPIPRTLSRRGGRDRAQRLSIMGNRVVARWFDAGAQTRERCARRLRRCHYTAAGRDGRSDGQVTGIECDAARAARAAATRLPAQRRFATATGRRDRHRARDATSSMRGPPIRGSSGSTLAPGGRPVMRPHRCLPIPISERD